MLVLHVQALANMLRNSRVTSVMGAFTRKHIANHLYLPQSCNHLACFRLECIFTRSAYVPYKRACLAP